MTVQSEYQLENELIAQLKGLGYSIVTIKDERQLLSNLKTQIERANGLASLSETEWKQVISHLNSAQYLSAPKICVICSQSNLMMEPVNTFFPV